MADKTYQTTLLIRGDSKDAVRSVQLTRDQLEQLTGVQKKGIAITSQLGGAYNSMGKSLAALGIGATVAMGIRKVIEETGESEAAVAQLNATLKATGGAAGKTADELIKTANSLQQTTTYSDEAVLGVEDLLLKFKNIKGDTFDRTTKAVLDMATAMKVDASSAAKTIGKALEDPEKAASRLAKANVILTASQKDTLKALVEMGDVAGQQDFILAQLESRFIGSAEAAKGTLGGAIDSLKNSFGELFELDKGQSARITGGINDLNKSISDPSFKEGIDNLVAGLLSVVSMSAQALGGLTRLGNYLGDFAATARESVNGTASGIANLSQELATAAQRLAKFNDEGGNKQTLAYSTLVSNVDRLKGALLLSEIAYDKTKTSADAYIDSVYKGATATDKAVETQGKFTLVVNNSADATKKKTAATKEATATGLKSAETLKKESDAYKKLAAEVEKNKRVHDAWDKRIKAVTKSMDDAGSELDQLVKKDKTYIEALQLEITQLGLSERQRFIDNKVIEAGTRLREDQIAKVKELSGELYDETLAVEQTTKMWGHLTDSMSDIFTQLVTGADKSKGVFDTVSDGFSAMIDKMLAEAASNEIVIAMGGTTASGQNSGNSDFSSRIEQAGWTYAISRLASSVTTAFNGSKEDIENGDELTKGINWFAKKSWKVAELFGAKKFDKVFGQQNDGNNTGGANFDAASGNVSGYGVGKSFDQGNVDFAAQLAQQLVETAKLLGGSTAKGNVQVSNKSGIQYGGNNYGQDIDKFFGAAYKDIIAGATALDAGVKSLLIDFAGASEELGRFAGAIISLNEAVTDNTVTMAIEDYSNSTKSLRDVYLDTETALKASLVAYDGSASAAESLNTALVTNKLAAYGFATAIQQIGQSIQELSSTQAESIRESVLSARELSAKRTAERDALKNSLSSITDPAQVEKTTQRILQLNQQIYDSLSDNQKQIQFDAFAQFAENTNTVAQQVLSRSLEGLKITQDDINIKLSQMLERVGGVQLQAANTQQAAANIMWTAAQLINSAANRTGTYSELAA